MIVERPIRPVLERAVMPQPAFDLSILEDDGPALFDPLDVRPEGLRLSHEAAAHEFGQSTFVEPALEPQADDQCPGVRREGQPLPVQSPCERSPSKRRPEQGKPAPARFVNRDRKIADQLAYELAASPLVEGERQRAVGGWPECTSIIVEQREHFGPIVEPAVEQRDGSGCADEGLLFMHRFGRGAIGKADHPRRPRFPDRCPVQSPRRGGLDHGRQQASRGLGRIQKKHSSNGAQRLLPCSEPEPGIGPACPRLFGDQQILAECPLHKLGDIGRDQRDAYPMYLGNHLANVGRLMALAELEPDTCRRSVEGMIAAVPAVEEQKLGLAGAPRDRWCAFDSRGRLRGLGCARLPGHSAIRHILTRSCV